MTVLERIWRACALGVVCVMAGGAGCAAPAAPTRTTTSPPIVVPEAPAIAAGAKEAPRATEPRGDEAKLAELVKARASFEAFVARADGRPEYAAAVARAKERIEDIDQMLKVFAGR